MVAYAVNDKGQIHIDFLILCLLLAVLPAPAMAADSGPNIPLFQTTDGLAVIEAEDTYFASEVFSAVSGGDMSGGKGIYTSKGPLNPDKIVEESEIPIEKPVNMAFQVKADHTGTYALWLRVKPNSESKSIFVSVNDGAYNSMSVGAMPGEWHWFKVASTYRIEKDSVITYKLSPNNPWFTIDKAVVTSQRFVHPEGIDGTLAEDDTTLPGGVYNAPSFTPRHSIRACTSRRRIFRGFSLTQKRRKMPRHGASIRQI